VSQAAKVLLIDDEKSILDLVSANLQPEGYEIQTALDGRAGLKLARAFKPDVIVLDIMLPEMDGIELLSQLRRESEAYVIMLTAKTEETDKIIGLSVGADDYVTKPFSPRELVARIKAALRRMRIGRGLPDEQILSYAHLRIDSGSRRAWMDDREIELTTMEFDLLWALAEHPGKVLSRERLLERVWGYDYYGGSRTVDVHVRRLRAKIGEERAGWITTVRSVGYRFG
jgi:two-component system alkaline phosphatase synthesis response regulator PhoP